MLELRRISLADNGVIEEEVTTTPLIARRGFVAIPTPDVEAYVRSQFLTFAAGFVVGMSAGALLGNLFARNR